MSSVNGIIVIDKPMDFTSFDVVAVMRKLCMQKKIGHCGTLDPNATGVLPLLLGNATKAQDIIPNHDKTYIASFKLGFTSNTLDIWGEVTQSSLTPTITTQQLKAILQNFCGEINQTPPMYSAIQVNGQRLYDLARKGIEIERESRLVTVYELELLEFDESLQEGKIKVGCSKGTYIRTIIDDMGKMLGCGAVMSNLRRTAACGYTLENVLPLEKARVMETEQILSYLLPVESLFVCYGYVAVSEAQARRFSNGGALDIARTYLAKGYEDNAIYRIKDKEHNFLGLGIACKDTNEIKIYKLFK